jgi:hypothetical protein
MKLSIITITCRPEPRFLDVANAIAGNLVAALASKAFTLSWIVVDDLLSSGSPETRVAREAGLKRVVDGRFALYHVAPKPSKVRGPWRETSEDLPDQNNARNTGLAMAMAINTDYVIYLDDCTIPTQSLLECAVLAAGKAVCLRVPIVFKTDIAVPQDGKVSMGESGGMRLAPCKATTAAGGCFGMPIDALKAIGGFDEVYAGAMGKQDLDAFVRAERAGWKWMTSKRCAAIQLSKTHDKASVSRNDDALSGRASMQPWNDLLRDKQRFAPVIDCELEKHVKAAKDRLEQAKRPAVVLPPTPVEIVGKLPLKPPAAESSDPFSEPTGVGD